MDELEQLRAEVASFPRWHYEFDLNGVRTPIFNPAHVNRTAQRKRYFFDPLVELCGGTLTGKRVLDLGCNAGFWSLAAIDAGADAVVGIDGRQMHVDQAKLVFRVKGVDRSRYRFEVGDLFRTEIDDAPFDIVLCLGLLYHVSKPFELMERVSAWNTDLLVIDTTLDTSLGPSFRMKGQNLDDPRSALDRPVALHPTSEAVAWMVQVFGYQSVMLKPRFTNWQASGSYRGARRRAFICSKNTPLAGLDTEPIGANVPAPVAAATRLLRRLARLHQRAHRLRSRARRR